MDAHQNAGRFGSFAPLYDAFRPACPPAAIEILSAFSPDRRPRLVVDLGCGTGLSTLAWRGRADRVVGVEPSAGMLAVAKRKPEGDGGVEFRQAFSDQTGLPDGCADVVTCSQSFHWMDPATTLPEIARILRPGGVFAAYDCDWPAVCDWRAELAYCALFSRVKELSRKKPESTGARWDKSRHLENIRKSGRFRFTREILFSNVEQGDARRFFGLALSQGTLQKLLKAGLMTEDEIERFRAAVDNAFAGRTLPFRFCYRMRIGVR